MKPCVEKLLQINKTHADSYLNQAGLRQIYRAQHPTEIAAIKCMDGRLHLPVMTNTALGVIQPWRNLGGKFNLGWPHFQDTIFEWTAYAYSRGRNAIVLTTYHYARGHEGEDPSKVHHRGCAGFGYDTDAAREASGKLKLQFERVFKNDGLYAIQCGIETDLDALILHGYNGEVVDLAEVKFESAEEIEGMLRRLYPQIPVDILRDLIPLVQGNIQHIAEIKASTRPIADAEHKEWVIALGRGFDWLHEINTALIVGPFDPDLEGAIATAAGLLKGNIEAGRINPKDGLVLLVSTPYREGAGYRQRKAEEKANYLSNMAYEVISERVPEILPYLSTVTATIDMNNRTLNVLSDK